MKDGKKEMFYRTTHTTYFYITVIWRRTLAAATTWVTLFN